MNPKKNLPFSLNKAYLKLISLALLVYSSNVLVAQEASLEFFSISEHLSNSTPMKITQGEDGFVWVLGNSVNRYDGYNFKTIKYQNEKFSDDIYYDKKLYITENDVSVFHSGKHFYFRQIKTGQLDSVNFKKHLRENEVVNFEYVHEKKNGELIFFFYNTSTQQATALEIKNKELHRKFVINDIGFTDLMGFRRIVSDSAGNFYYFRKGQEFIVQLDEQGNKIKTYKNLPVKQHHATSLEITSQGSLFFARYDEILFLNPVSQQIEYHPVSPFIKSWKEKVNDILEMDNGDLWITGYERNLLFYDKSKDKVFQFRDKIKELIPRRVNLNDLILDKTGVIWVQTVLGIIKIVPQQGLFDNYYDTPLPECNGYCSFRGITENEEGQIFASYYKGIFQIDPKTKTSSKPFPDISRTPMGLGYDNGYLLLNSGERLNIEKGKFDPLSKPINPIEIDLGSLAKDHNGNWWNAQYGELWFYDRNSSDPNWKKSIDIPHSLDRLYLNYGEFSQHIWVADGHFLFRFNVEKQALTKYIELTKGINILSTYEDKDQTLWLGTNKGLIEVSEQVARNTYTQKEGLSNNYISGILSEGDSCLWLATNYGLSRFQKEKKNFLNFYEEDGLSHNEFNRVSYYKSKRGQLFFGGMQGINAFFPEEVMNSYNRQQHLGSVVLESVSKIDERIDSTISQEIKLNESDLAIHHWDKSITFRFCLTDYRNSEKTQYSYMLEGYENVWSKPSNYNFTTYSSYHQVITHSV